MKRFLPITSKSMTDLGASTHEEMWRKAQADGYQGISLVVATTFTKAEEGENRYAFVFSTDSEDRHGDIVEQNFDLRHFKKNPVFLDSHDYWTIEAIIGRVKITESDKRLAGEVEYALENPRGALAAKLTEGGFLNATSIGFIPKEFDDKGNILKSELLEISAVSVPANPEAVRERSIEPEALEAEPTVEDQPTAEPEEELVTVPEKKVNPLAVAAKVTGEMVAVRKSNLKALAKAVHNLTEENKQSERRKIHQAVRRLLNT